MVKHVQCGAHQPSDPQPTLCWFARWPSRAPCCGVRFLIPTLVLWCGVDVQTAPIIFLAVVIQAELWIRAKTLCAILVTNKRALTGRPSVSDSSRRVRPEHIAQSGVCRGRRAVRMPSRMPVIMIMIR